MFTMFDECPCFHDMKHVQNCITNISDQMQIEQWYGQVMNTFPHDAITFCFLMRSFAMMTDMCPTCMCHQCGEHNPTTTCSIESHVSSTHNESRALHVCRTIGMCCYVWIFSLRDVLHCRNSECCILDEIQNANDVFGDNMNSWCQETWMMWFLFLSQIRHMFVQVHDKISVIQWYWLFRRVVTIDLHRRSVSGCTHETFYIAVCSSDEQPLLFGFSKSQKEPMQVFLFPRCVVFLVFHVSAKGLLFGGGLFRLWCVAMFGTSFWRFLIKADDVLLFDWWHS